MAKYLAMKKRVHDAKGLTQNQRVAEYNRYKNKNRKIKIKTVNVQSKPRTAIRYVESKKSMQECTLTYARVMANPMDDTISEACIPDTICAQSYKYSTISMGVCTVGTQGVAFVAYNPWTMSAGDYAYSGGHLDFPLIATTATYPTNSYRAFAADILDGRTIGLNSNTLLTNAQVSTGELRLVGAGVQISYTGQKLIQSGVITTLQADGLRAFNNDTPISALQLNARSYTCAVSDKTCTLTYTPVDFADTGYSQIANYLGTGPRAVSGQYYPLVILISGAPPGATFQIRAKAYFEAQFRGMPATPSHADPQGMATVLEAKTALPKGGEPVDDFITVVKQAARQLSGYAPVLGGAIGASLGVPELGIQSGTLTKNIIEALLN